MEKPACIFGPAFREERTKRNISLWKIVHETGGYLATLQRVEKGQTQPGVLNALKLLNIIDVNPGDFLQKIADDHPTAFPSLQPKLHTNFLELISPDFDNAPKSLFGPMLVKARTTCGISQAEMAKRAGYNLRNINPVEKGEQEPGIITALSLVMATETDVRIFFSQLYEMYITLRSVGIENIEI